MKKAIICIVILIFLIWLYNVKSDTKNSTLGKIQKPPKIRIVYSRKVKDSELPKINSQESAVKVLRQIWSSQMQVQEEFAVLFLNNSNRVIGYQILSKGTITGTSVDLRILFATALKSLAVAIILAHNHPSGTLRASLADKNITKRIVDASEYFNIKVLDHIILTKDSYLSFNAEGLLTT